MCVSVCVCVWSVARELFMCVCFWVCLSVYLRNRNFTKAAQQTLFQLDPWESAGNNSISSPFPPGSDEEHPVRRGVSEGLLESSRILSLGSPPPHSLPSVVTRPLRRRRPRREEDLGVPSSILPPSCFSGSSTGGSAEPRGICFSSGTREASPS